MTASLKDDRSRGLTTSAAMPCAEAARMRPVAVPTTTNDFPTQSATPVSSAMPIQCRDALVLCMLDSTFGG